MSATRTDPDASRDLARENAELRERLAHQHEQVEVLLEALPVGVLVVNDAACIVRANAAAHRLLRAEALSLEGTALDDLPAPLVTLLAEAVARGQRIRGHELKLAGAGREVVILRVQCIQADGGRGAIILIEDISTTRQVEDRLRHGDRLASMGTLAAGMAHEIKNPLQTLKTFAQLLPERYDDPDFRQSFSDLIGQEVHRIDTLVGQLLRFARPAQPHFAPLAAHDIIGHTLRLLRQQIRQREVTLETNLLAERDTVSGDADLLQQALVNLVLNALDAMEQGGRLVVSTDVHKSARAPRGLFLRVTIRDTGPGIDPADLPRVFDPFFTTKSSGTGLGLSVSHGIATDHGGRLHAESAPGEGATFHLLLPLVRAEKAR